MSLICAVIFVHQTLEEIFDFGSIIAYRVTRLSRFADAKQLGNHDAKQKRKCGC